MSQDARALDAYNQALTHLCDNYLLDPLSDSDEWAKYDVFQRFVHLIGAPISVQDFKKAPPPTDTVHWFPNVGRIMVLKPISSQNGRVCMPVVGIRTQYEVTTAGENVQRKLCHCSIQVALLTTTCLLKDATDDQVCAIGLRYELSEAMSANGAGNHDYAHVQFVRELRRSTRAPFILPGVPAWLPDSQPAFPLDGDEIDAAALIANLLQSFYGRRAVAALNTSWHIPWLAERNHPQHPRVFTPKK